MENIKAQNNAIKSTHSKALSPRTEHARTAVSTITSENALENDQSAMLIRGSIIPYRMSTT